MIKKETSLIMKSDCLHVCLISYGKIDFLLQPNYFFKYGDWLSAMDRRETIST